MLTIGKFAALTGTTSNAIRYYEREGLLPPADKGDNGYRRYPQTAAMHVHFIRQAQACGFSLAEIRRLQTIPTLASACCVDVRQLAIDKKRELDSKIAVMRAMTKDLDQLIQDCAARERALDDCPILHALRGEATPPDS